MQRLEAVPAERQNSETLESLEVGDAGILKAAFPAALHCIEKLELCQGLETPRNRFKLSKDEKKIEPGTAG